MHQQYRAKRALADFLDILVAAIDDCSDFQFRDIQDLLNLRFLALGGNQLLDLCLVDEQGLRVLLHFFCTNIFCHHGCRELRIDFLYRLIRVVDNRRVIGLFDLLQHAANGFCALLIREVRYRLDRFDLDLAFGALE